MGKPDKNLVQLGDDYTYIDMSPEDRFTAVSDAYWVTCSPVEHTWTPEQTTRMARYVLWATQRLTAIEYVVSGQPMRIPPEKTT